jgi:UDP-N-acetyl-2-amino-2-deoxyglucuronate dehydrogenase
MAIKFGLIGKGAISEKHINAIQSIGGELVQIYDPLLSNLQTVEDLFKYDFDYTVICSPSNFHYEHTKLALKNNRKVILEKPQNLSWEPQLDNDDINIVLQYNWLDDFPKQADIIKVVMIRDEKYFKSWKGDVQKTGGVFPLLFIHYIDLAIKLNSKFSGLVIPEGEQVRKIDDLNLMKIDMNRLYSRMYHDICHNNKGIKPKDTMFLNWIIERLGWNFGHGYDILGKQIEFRPNDLIDLVRKEF